MFFILSRFVSFLISPLSWTIIFLLTGIFLKDRQQKRRFYFLSLITLIFFSNTFIFDRFMHAWEYPAIAENDLPVCDAGILLTGMSTYDMHLRRIEFNDRTDRLMQAIRLYKDDKIKKIILCGGPVKIDADDSTETILLAHYLYKTGIDSADIIVEDHSRNTNENALYLKPILEKQFDHGQFLLITSAAHMNRAAACFLKQGINIIPFSTDRYSGPVKYEFDYLILPSAATLFNWEKLIHEWLGMIFYKISNYC